MMRNIYLEGEMGEKFGTHFYFNAPTVQDALKCLEANFPGFKKYLIDCHQESVGFIIDVADNTIEYIEECIMTLKEGDITITPVPAGSKSGVGKILAAIAIVVVAIYAPQLFGTLGPGGMGPATSGLLGTGGSVFGVSTAAIQTGLYSMAVNLAMTGINQMMAPDPGSDQDQEQSYLFNGAESNTVQGDPMPILYGLLRVPGQPISFEIAGINSSISTLGFGANGNSFGSTVVAG